MEGIHLIAIIVPVVFLMNLIAYFVFIPHRYRIENRISAADYRSMQTFTSEILPHLLLVSFIYILVKSQGVIVSIFEISPDYDLAQYILHMEGSSVSMFQAFTHPLLTYVSSFIYIFGFSFLLIFTFVALIFTRHSQALREYAIAIAIIYMTAFPFYIFTPVKVTGHTLPEVMPLLYNLSPIVYEGLKTVDPFFDNCFPSLHAALSILAMLFIVFRTDLKRFKMFAVIITLAIQFTIFYLGIHWITDFVGGIILAIFSFHVATRYSYWIPGKVRVSYDRDDR
ncbi:phosphatase PAP2 family protein [Methanolobus psychrotolerans]|uniref:phosphatase PAP2 family protein n=1 Tax=Methanolobus psychrotolerans TaxID=1874706 RepID=UPI000B91C60B|nr:phosphatase PAP2 family protein [Methanolobus psychrotolerans]